jgi:fatty acid CoA ligase FadD36
MSDLLAALTGRFGDRPDAVTVGDSACSWASLADGAGALAGAIAGLDVVVVCATATMETVVAVAAGILAGVTVVPLPPDAGAMERAHIVGHSGATAFLGDPGGDVLGLAVVPRPQAIGP